ncbi:MAG: TldD/PmbA family protein [Candidatus Thorarchaeota archaeon]
MTLEGRDAADLAIELAMAKGAQFAEARFVQGCVNQFLLKNGNPEIGAFERSSGLGLRLIVDGAAGFASMNVLTQKSLEESISAALKIARTSRSLRRAPLQLSEEPANTATYEAKALDKPVDKHPEDKVRLLGEIDASMATHQLPFRFCLLWDNDERKYYVNSEGSRIESYIPRVMFFGVMTAISSNGQMEQSMIMKGASGGYEWIERWNLYEFLTKEAETLNKIVSEATAPPTGNVDFVVGPNVAGIIAHENCGHPSEADRILGREAAQAGESYLAPDFLGERVGNDSLTIIDDPTIEGSFGYFLYDDEGVKTRPKTLIKEGVFNEMIHNRESAFIFGTHSTAASRSETFSREPIPRMSNTFIAPGELNWDEIFEDIKLGIYMINFTEWNIDDRRFQSKYIGMECYLIKNGELTSELIKRPVLETTTTDLFEAIDGSAKGDVEFTAALCGKGDPPQAVPVWAGGSRGTRIRNIRI